jgi:hypothetical protein
MEYSLITEKSGRAERYPEYTGLFLLMSVLSETLLTLVRRHFVLLSFLTAWHSLLIFAPLIKRRVTRL